MDGDVLIQKVDLYSNILVGLGTKRTQFPS